MAVFTPAVAGDDIRWVYNNTGIDSGCYLGAINGLTTPISGIRFLNVTIPKGSTILTAKVVFQAYENLSSTTCNVQIKGEAVDDSAAMFTYENFAGRSRTTAYVDWSNIGSWTADSDYDSPSIITIITEITGRSGWASGNDLTLFFADNASTTGQDTYRRPKVAIADIGSVPRLTVTYSDGGGRNNVMIF
jgi:hypothetical protein